MGFLQSYLRLPRYQRVLLGLVGVAVGWYGPELMSQLFLRDAKTNTRVKAGDCGTPRTPPSSSSSTSRV